MRVNNTDESALAVEPFVPAADRFTTLLEKAVYFALRHRISDAEQPYSELKELIVQQQDYSAYIGIMAERSRRDLFWLAVSMNDLVLVTELLTNYSSIISPNQLYTRQKESALFDAKSMEMVRLLVDRGASLDIESEEKEKPSHNMYVAAYQAELAGADLPVDQLPLDSAQEIQSLSQGAGVQMRFGYLRDSKRARGHITCQMVTAYLYHIGATIINNGGLASIEGMAEVTRNLEEIILKTISNSTVVATINNPLLKRYNDIPDTYGPGGTRKHLKTLYVLLMALRCMTFNEIEEVRNLINVSGLTTGAGGGKFANGGQYPNDGFASSLLTLYQCLNYSELLRGDEKELASDDGLIRCIAQNFMGQFFCPSAPAMSRTQMVTSLMKEQPSAVSPAL